MLELVVDPDQRDLVQLRTLELSSDRPGRNSYLFGAFQVQRRACKLYANVRTGRVPLASRGTLMLRS